MSRFFVSLIMFGIGFALIRYSYQITKTFGYTEFGEKWFGSGGTYTFYKVLGTIIVIISLLNVLGITNIIIGGAARTFIPSID